jgi:hypothetical protein
LVGKPEEERLLGRSKRRWRDKKPTSNCVEETGFGDLDWVNLLRIATKDLLL